MKFRQVSCLLLIVMGCLGFVTVADDLDHTGELFAVGGLLMAGVVFLVDGSNLRMVQRIPLYWVAVGIGIGEIVGAMLGQVPKGTGGGAIIGAIGTVILTCRKL